MAATTPFKRDLPFIHRAWKTAVGHLSPYAPGGLFAATNGDNGVTVNGDGAAHRPAKRRRLTPDSSDRALGDAVSRILPDDPCDFEKALRVEILKVTQQGGPSFDPDHLLKSTSSPAKKDAEAPRIRCRCKLLICRAPRPEDIRLLYCDSQICNIKVFADAEGDRRMARLYLTKPFHIPADKLYILRDDDDMFDLDDGYFVQIELESAGDSQWPPLSLLPDDRRDDPKGSSRHWVLSASATYQFDRHRMSAPMKLRRQTGMEESLDLEMDVDFRWSTNHSGPPPQPMKVDSPLEPKVAANGALEPLTCGQLNQSVDSARTTRSGDGHEAMEDEEDEVGEAVTPTRALRQKKKQIYNLKALSDKARGKDLKERKRQAKAAAESGPEVGQVTWVLPQLGAVTTSDFGCIRCYATHFSHAQLLRHMEDHPEYKFRFDVDSRNVTRILISQHGHTTPEPDDMEIESPREITPRKQPRPRPAQAKHRLPPAKPKDPRQLIPDNKQPLYDRVSKATLTPGALIEPPPVDDSWLMQKHRDVILDYSDVHAEEKEYICEWDAFVLKERVTSEPHLQHVYLSFIEEKATWLVSRQSRMTEFAKHLTYLKARSSLTQETITKAFAMLREAKTYSQEDTPNDDEPKAASPRVEGRKSASGCGICGQPVRGPSTLICDNEDCDRPFYHDDCIRADAKLPVSSRKWQCNECYEDAMVVD